MFREVTAFTGAALPVRAGESDAPPKKAAQEGQFVSPCRPSSSPPSPASSPAAAASSSSPSPPSPRHSKAPCTPVLSGRESPRPQAGHGRCAPQSRRHACRRETPAAARPARARAGRRPLPLLLGERLSEQERGGPRASVRDAHARARGRPCCAQAAAAVPAADGSAAATAQATRAR